MKKVFLCLVLLLPMVVSAHDIEVANDDDVTIYYSWTNNKTELAVSFRGSSYSDYTNEYSGIVNIPETVVYNGVTYSVTSIGSEAFYECTDVTSVAIPNSVTSIGNQAFRACIGLLNLTIPNSVTSIGNSAFCQCSGLSNVTIPNSVKSMGDSAFYYCSGLTNVAIPNSVTSISQYAFLGCSSLTSVTIPNSVTSIGKAAFTDCSSLSNVTIPNSVKSIGSSAFSGCSSLTSVTISDIASWCSTLFYDENSNPLHYAQHLYMNGEEINSLVIPNTVMSIGNHAFDGCTGLTSVTIPSSVTSIGSEAFSGCSGLTFVFIPNSVISIGGAAFYGCSGLTSITIPNSLASISNYTFYGCSGLTSLYIPQSVTSIGDYSFSECYGLTSIEVEEGNPKYDSRDNCNAIIVTAANRLILACSNTVIPNSVTSWSDGAFQNCVSFSLPEGFETITHNMFINCTHLETIKIPGSVKTISEGAFGGCISLKNVIFEEGTDTLKFSPASTEYSTDPTWFANCPVETVKIGRNIDYTYMSTRNGTISKSPFRDCHTITEVVYSDIVSIIPLGMFSRCVNLSSVKWPSNLTKIGNNAFYRCNMLKAIDICRNVSEIGDNCFSGCSNVSSLYIPNNVQIIGNGAFNDVCLSKLIVEEGSNRITAPNVSSLCMFSGSIDSVYLGRHGTTFSVKKIKQVTIGMAIDTFYDIGCDSINTLLIEESADTLNFYITRELNYGTFKYYYVSPFDKTIIDSIYCDRPVVSKNIYTSTEYSPYFSIPSSFAFRFGPHITNIDQKYFYESKISSVYIPNSVQSIATNSFQMCSNLSSVYIEDGLNNLDFDDGSNYYGSPIERLYLGRNISYTSNTPFNSNKESLKYLQIGEKVEEIGESLFSGFSNLISLALSKGLEIIGQKAFYGCTQLTALSIPNSVMVIGQQAFDLCRGLKTLMIEDGTEELRFTANTNQLNNSFVNSPLEDVYIGRNISFPSVSPVCGLSTIVSTTIGNKVTHISDGLFSGCDGLISVTVKLSQPLLIVANTFSNRFNAMLFVPRGSKAAYKAAEYWRDFMDMTEVGNYEPGDCNEDGFITISDAIEVVKYVLGIPSTHFFLETADTNGDGEITISDAVCIVDIILGNNNARMKPQE